jgi:hypothetical protein
MIALLVGIACEALALDGMKDILYLAVSDAGMAEQVRQAVAQARPHYDLSRALQGELVVTLATIGLLRHSGPKSLGELLGSDREERSPKRKETPAAHGRPARADHRLFDQLMDAGEADYLRYMRRAIASSTRPYPANQTLFTQLDRELLANYSTPTDHPVHAIIGILLPMLGQIGHVVAQAEAREEVVMAGAGLLAYKARHGSFPATIEEALSRPPLDPFSGRTLRYRREGDGFVVYSVGREGRFDGGRPGGKISGREVYFRYPVVPTSQPRRGAIRFRFKVGRAVMTRPTRAAYGRQRLNITPSIDINCGVFGWSGPVPASVVQMSAPLYGPCSTTWPASFPS